MEAHLPLLYARFCNYVARLDSDLKQIALKLPPEKRSVFSFPGCSYEVFCERWDLIARDETLLQRWMSRFDPSGYEAEQAKIMSAITALGLASPNRRNAAA